MQHCCEALYHRHLLQLDALAFDLCAVSELAASSYCTDDTSAWRSIDALPWKRLTLRSDSACGPPFVNYCNVAFAVLGASACALALRLRCSRSPFTAVALYICAR